jgi:hypothetical protein
MVAAFVITGIAAGMFDVAQGALFWGPRPLGFLLGGFAGTLFGLIPTIVLGGIICTVSTFFWVAPRIVSLRVAPEPVES